MKEGKTTIKQLFGERGTIMSDDCIRWSFWESGNNLWFSRNRENDFAEGKSTEHDKLL